jgi:TonB family protein
LAVSSVKKNQENIPNLVLVSIASMDKGEKLIKKPTYPGGRSAMAAFVKENMVYPEKALVNKIQGTVAVVIDIDENGFVTKEQVKKGIGYGCDEEAIRICKLMKFSTASKRKNKKITFHRTINIGFKLPKPILKKNPLKKEVKNTPAKGMKIVYSYVPKKK